MFHRMMNFGELDARPTLVLTKDLIKKNIPKYKKHDDMLVIQEHAWEEFKRTILIPVVYEENNPFTIDEDELASLVCQSVQKPCCRLAIEKGVNNDDYRTPNVKLILGHNGLVSHKDNQITYQFDVTKCMFSFGNVREKMRMAELDCSDEIVVDLFAGIGYFTLPLIIHAKAKHIYACEWNPDAIEALRGNLNLNKVESSRFTVIEGDNRSNRPTEVAQRVILGILPSCSDYMKAALDCVDKKTGATLHCHELVELKQVVSVPNCQNQKNFSDLLETATPLVERSHASADEQSLLTQSISSSCSSHSTIEKLNVPTEDKTHTSESEKDNGSAILVDNSLSSTPTSNTPNLSCNEASSNILETSSISSQQEDIAAAIGSDAGVYEVKSSSLIAKIRDELEAHNMIARLVHIQPVKSYAPHIKHVVFDIRVEPRPNMDSTT